LDENTGAVIGEILRNVPTLKKLSLDHMRHNMLAEDQGFVRLAPSIGVLENLEELNVEWSDIEDGEDMTALNRSLQSLPKLKVLRLDGNFIEKDCRVLLQDLKHSNLEELYLSANRIFHFKHLIPRLPHKLEFLDLSENFILGRMELQRAFSQKLPNVEVNLEDQQSAED
jgi:Leucine-rich repeat (LRR) protein